MGRWIRRTVTAVLATSLTVVCFWSTPVASYAIDDSLGIYFEQLRQRGLYSIAESYAVTRLSQPNLPRARRIELTLELSKTLASHAEIVSEQQQQELLAKARSILEAERVRAPGMYSVVLAAQSALISAGVSEWLKTECELRPFDEELAVKTRLLCAESIQQLGLAERDLLVPPKKDATDAPPSHLLRVMLHRVRLGLAQSLRNRAALTASDARQRTSDLVDAETTARKLIGNADEPIPSRAKILLVSCMRLKGEFARAEEMLVALEKGANAVDDSLLEEVATERVRLLLDRRQAPTALQLIVEIRSARQRLTGELWYLQVRALLDMRELAVSRKNNELADSLREQAEVTLQRCDEQVGGFWSRRCHQLWEATRTAEKYGPELDAMMQQARADFLAGRSDVALKGYARAEAAARTAGQGDLAVELGYTRSSILLQEKQFELAGTEFLRLAGDYPQSPRAAAAHLNAAYCFGRLYDEQKTQSRRERYTQALDEHLERFASDPTADEARFLKAQLEEQRLQSLSALPLYLKVSETHPKSEESRAGAARCYETILIRMREKKLPTAEFERTAVTQLQKYMALLSGPEAVWTASTGEVALHLSAVYLLAEPPQFERAEALLTQLIQTASVITDDDEFADRWKKLRQRAESLRVVALAGNGRPVEAARVIDSLAAASPRDLLVIVDRLAPFVASPNRQRQIQYATLQLRAVEQLSQHRSSLSAQEQDQLDQSVGRALLASGQITKALEIYERQATAAAKDASRQREIATLLSGFEPRECAVLAKQCWRRAESLTKQGSAEWLTARLGVISTGIQLNEIAESKKLMSLTKILYPDLGGPDLKSRFEAADRQLQGK